MLDQLCCGCLGEDRAPSPQYRSTDTEDHTKTFGVKSSILGSFIEAEGEFDDENILTGMGEVYIREDTLYNGELRSGMREGKGVYIKGSEKYDGAWKNDMREGLGTQYQDDGTILTCEWKENVPNGIAAI